MLFIFNKLHYNYTPRCAPKGLLRVASGRPSIRYSFEQIGLDLAVHSLLKEVMHVILGLNYCLALHITPIKELFH